MSQASSERIACDVLLVEDNRADVVLLTKAFETTRANHRLHVAVDGDQAIAFLRRDDGYQNAPRPALILLDLNLPGKDGREVLAEVKSDTELRRIPIVILTSSFSDDDVVNCYDLHANAYMTKVVEFEQLLDLTRQIDEYWLSTVRLSPR